VLSCAGLAGIASGQTVRTWTSDSDQRWNRNQNWSGNNQANTSSEIAQFGTGGQLNPELNANSLTVRGIRFSAGAGGYNVADDNGSRTLRIGNGSSGFIENLSATDQVISIATLQFQSDATISTTGSGGLTLGSQLTGTNRDLTFDAAADITVTGNITTGSGTLTKEGAGSLHLAGANTYTGTTIISAGTIVAEAAGVFADTGQIDIADGAGLDLNDFAETIGRITGAGTVDLGAAGTGALTLGAGNSTFGGVFSGAGEIIIGAGAILTLGMDFNNANLNIRLDGGTLRLNGSDIAIGALSVTGNSVIDFAAGSDSTLQIASLAFGSTSLELAVQNWTDAADYFFSQANYVQGSAPLDQVSFTGWDPADTKWQAYDSQVTPVPEPATYGAWLVGGALVAGWWWRRCRA
jgi:autotransporter-associated beta strand protein